MAPLAPRAQRQAGGLVVDAPVGAGRGRGGHRGVGGEHRRAALGAAAQLDLLEQAGGRAADGDGVGVLGGQVVELRDDAQGGREIGGIDAVLGHR